MKRLLLFSLALLLAVNFALFSGGQKDKAAQEVVTIEILFEGEVSDLLDKQFKDFDAAYPNINLKVISFPGDPKDYETKLLTSMAAGAAPDLFTTHDNTTYRYAVDKLILPAPEDVAAYIKDNAPPAIKDGLMHSLSAEGKIYGAPWQADWVALIWNKDMFAEAGLPGAPKTIPDMTEYAKKLTITDASGTITRSGLSMRISGHPAGIVDKFISFFSAFGGKMVSDDLKTPLFDQPPAKEAVQYYLDILYKYKIDGLDNPRDYRAFGNKQTAMFGRGPWVVPRFKEIAPDLVYGTNYEVAVFPEYHAKAESIAFIDAIAVSKGAKHPNEAWDLIRWLVMDEKRFASSQIESGSVPLLTTAAKDPYYQGEGQFMKVYMDQAVWQEPHHKHFYELKTKFGGYLERIIYKKMGIDEALKKAADEAKAILARTY